MKQSQPTRSPGFALIITGIVASVVGCAEGTLPQRGKNDPTNPRALETPLLASATMAAHEAPVGRSPMGSSSGATTYTCPMHPEVQADKPGSCPKCGMTLVPKTKP